MWRSISGGAVKMEINTVPWGIPLWDGEGIMRNSRKTQTMNNWRIKRQLKRHCCHGNQGRSLLVSFFLSFFF
jgi:hypothetical protein